MRITATLSFLLALALGVPGAYADGDAQHQGGGDEGLVAVPPPAALARPRPKITPEQDAKARQYFTDLPVLTHEGEQLRFYSDVLRGRTVAVTFFYTECLGMCPITNQKLATIQDLLGERLGKDIFLVTISVDPETDTPEVLREYRAKFEARDAWIFLTGDKGNIDEITKRLGQVYPIEAHLPVILIGNVATAHWQKLKPNLPEPAIATRLQLLADETATN